MAYEAVSSFFREVPHELLAPDGQFASDLRVLLAERDRLPELEDAVYEVGLVSALPDDDALARLAPGWDLEVLRSVLRAAVTLNGGVLGYGDRDSLDEWIDDLIGTGLIGRDSDGALRAVLGDLAAASERHRARARADFGVLPAYESLEYTTEVRGAMDAGRRLRLTGSCSVALHLDAGSPRTVFFQLNQAQLGKLIEALSRAAEELQSLQESVRRG